MRNQQYYIPPPDVPEFMYSFSFDAWKQLMMWSYREYRERLKRLSKGSYYKELNVQASDFSPERVLAEVSGFRKKCSIMNESLWKQFTREQQNYLIRCFNLRDLLLREEV